MINVNRDSSNDKINGLLHQMNQFSFEMKHFRNLNELPIKLSS